jgi:hypothetical protein
MRTSFCLFSLLTIALLGFNSNSLASSSAATNGVELDNKNVTDSSTDSVFIPLNEQTEISQDMMKVNDFLPFLSENAFSEEGHSLFYHLEMQDQIVCTQDDTGYHYTAVEGQGEKPILKISLEEKTDYCYWLSELDPDFFYDLPTAEELKQAGFDEEEGFRIVRCRRPDQSNLARTDAPQTQKSSGPSATKNKTQSKSWWSNSSNNSSATGGVGGAMMVGGGSASTASGTVVAADGLALDSSLTVSGGESMAGAEGALELLAALAVPEAFVVEEATAGAAAVEETGLFSWIGRAATRVWRTLFGRGSSAATRTVTREAVDGVVGRASGEGELLVARRSASQATSTIEGDLPVATERGGALKGPIDAQIADPYQRAEVEWLEQMSERNRLEIARKKASGEFDREWKEDGDRMLREITPDHPDYEFLKSIGALDSLK